MEAVSRDRDYLQNEVEGKKFMVSALVITPQILSNMARPGFSFDAGQMGECQ